MPADANRFKCKHCGKLPKSGMNPLLLDLVEDLEAFFGCIFRINSGYRCPAHNAATPGSSKTSKHMSGDACDLDVSRVKNIVDVDTLADVARTLGAEGVGRYYKSQFVHVDFGGKVRNWTDQT